MKDIATVSPDPSQLVDADTSHAIETADRVWWVGHVLDDDIFQCHVYLLEEGDQSVLFDPGSHFTCAGTLRKIEEVIPFTKIGYFVCLPFWLVEQHDWPLQLLDRELRFVFTPYAHFPGAICSFDPSTRALRRPHRGRTRNGPIATKQDPRRVGSGAPARPGHA